VLRALPARKLPLARGKRALGRRGSVVQAVVARALALTLGVALTMGGALPAAAQGWPAAPGFGVSGGQWASPAAGNSSWAAPAPSSGSVGLALAPAPPAAASEEVARMAEAVNALRVQNGRAPLRLQFQLGLAAQQHADAMARNRTMSHVGAAGTRPSDRMAAAGYDTCGGGENVSFAALQTVDDIARGWFDSPGHRAILLDPQAREMGIGRGQTADGVVYWALEVGQRPTVAPLVINGEAAATASSDVTLFLYPHVSDYCLGPTRGIVQVALSNSPDFADAQVVPYSPSVGWTLAPGEGPRTVYARLVDSAGRTLEVQDDILVSSTAPPPSTASDLTPPVQTFQVTGASGQPVQLTIQRTSYIVPPNAAVTTTPCPGSLTGCWTVGSMSGTAGAPAGAPPGPAPAAAPLPPGYNPAGPARPAGPLGPSPAPGLSGGYPSTPGAPAAVPGAPAAPPSGNCPLTGFC
jgi:uncharacterized protein YkwD